MTHVADRHVRCTITLLALFGLLAIPGVLSRQLVAQSSQDRWDPAIKKFEDADKVSPPPQNAIVFIGASSIVRWNLQESFPELGAQAINRGFGGSLAADSTGEVEFAVADEGPGLSEADKAKLFTQFNRLDGARKIRQPSPEPLVFGGHAGLQLALHAPQTAGNVHGAGPLPLHRHAAVDVEDVPGHEAGGG